MTRAEAEEALTQAAVEMHRLRCAAAAYRYAVITGEQPLPERVLDRDADAATARLLDAAHAYAKIAMVDMLRPEVPLSVSTGALVSACVLATMLTGER